MADPNPILRLIPGAVSQTDCRALILARQPGPDPSGELRNVRTGASTPLQISRVPVTKPLADRLAIYGFAPFAASALGLSPSTDYDIVVTAPGRTVRSAIRTLDAMLPPEGITIAVCSCYYGYFCVAHAYKAALNLKTAFPAPAFKLLIGDNLYADVAPDQLDFIRGYSETAARYARYFWQSDYAEVLATLPTFTTWDDHEFWNNYPEHQPHLARAQWPLRQSYVDAAQECTWVFQTPLNPPPVIDGGRSYVINISPLSIFVAETRSRRTMHDDDPPEMFPDKELEALEAWAGGLTGPGILVTGQPLWIDTGSWTDFNPPDFAAQYARIWSAVTRAPHDILLVSGDVHHSRLIRIEAGGRSVFEFITSPVSHVPTIGSIIRGDYHTQDRGGVSFPGTVPIDPTWQGAISPAFSKYLFGTDAPNSIGFLHLKPRTDNAVSVGCAFIDLRPDANGTPPRPARATTAKKDGQDIPPVIAECQGPDLFRLV